MKHENTIHEHLLAEGLTVQQASFLMDTTVSTVYKLKDGITFPDRKMQIAMQALFNCTLNDLYPWWNNEIETTRDLINRRRAVK